MRYDRMDIVFQEVPGEVSLLYSITGCPLKCPGCHSPELWQKESGAWLTLADLEVHLDRYDNQITCVCFFGGDWYENALISYLDMIRSRPLKTCLYTGLEWVSQGIYKRLDFLKTGPWQWQRGGLDSPTTNQRFVRVADGALLNNKFQS